MVWSVTPLPHWLHLRSNQQQFWPLNWRRTCLHEEVPNGLLVRSSKSNFGLWDLKSPTFCFDFSPVGVWGAYFASDRKVRQLRESYLEYFKIEPSTDFDSTSSRFGMRPWQSKSHWSTSLKAILILCTSVFWLCWPSEFQPATRKPSPRPSSLLIALHWKKNKIRWVTEVCCRCAWYEDCSVS